MEESKNKNQLATLDAKIANVKDVKEIFSIPDVKEIFKKNYAATTGKPDGDNKFEQERFAYLQLLADKPELRDVNKFFHLGAIVYAGTTGLTFRDGTLYVYPNGKGGLKVQASPAGKRQMMERMETISKVPTAQVVMKGDIFHFDKLNEIILKHETTEKSVIEEKLENIVAAYQRIKWKDGSITDVVVWQSELIRARSKSKIKGDGGVWEWVFQACQKTATNRAFSKYHKYADNVVVLHDDRPAEEEDDKPFIEADIMPAATNHGEIVDQDTGEVTEEVAKAEKPEEPKVEKRKKQIDLLSD